MNKAQDREYEETRISGLEAQRSGGWTITREDGWAFYVPDHGIEPHVGDVARFYGRGTGATVRGLDINGRTVFYRTPEEQWTEEERLAHVREQEKRQDYLDKAEGYERTIHDLPPVFQRRIERFRRTNPDFNWEYLPYELSCCVDGAKIALHCKTAEGVYEFSQLSWEQQQEQIPDLFDGHSGNSFSMACRLAHHYVSEPEYVVLEHGAIAVLVGCEDFGCQPGQGLEGEDLAFYQELAKQSS